ncbi:uncharacterized protein B0H18DRAFT_1210452, partial [Fomitopsis serialis]|uniref:uncharacterized protein n=1 Tax=Fomitopsis serialis TaxID=139415 RepID=UPI002008AC01
MPPRIIKRLKTPMVSADLKVRNTRSRTRSGLQDSDMLNMPMDIIHEILRHLLPHDLLSLTRTSKAFHAFLMRKSSAYYWKQSLKQVDGPLPRCPKELIEPAWVALVFSPICT